MFNLANTQSLTHRRNVYTNTVFNAMLTQGARDLDSGLETRDVVINAIAKIVAATVPNAGQGHAESIRQQVADSIDAILFLDQSPADTESDNEEETETA